MQRDFDAALDVLPEGVVVVHVRGDLDMATVPRVGQVLVNAGSPDTLVIDLADCAFVDSAALRLLTETARNVEERGGRMKLVATEPAVLRVLEMTALDTRLSVHPTLDAALA